MNRYVTATVLVTLGACGDGARDGARGISNTDGGALKPGAKAGAGSSTQGGPGGTGRQDDAAVDATGAAGADGPQRSSAATATYPLALSANKDYLVDAHGNPWFLQGDAAWELIPSLEQADALTYLNDRQSRGYSAIIVQAMEHKFTTHSPPWLDVYGNAPFTAAVPGSSDLDFTTPSDAYWKNVDWILQQANARGIVVLFFPAYLGYICQDEGWCRPMGTNGTARMVTYGTYLGNRYKDQPNIIWVLGGDDTATGDALAEVNGIIQGIRAAGDTHLMTAHWGDEESAADNDLSTIPWLQIDTLYTYKDQDLYTKAQSDYARDKGVRPEFLIEADYEGEHPNSATTSDTWRAQMYEPPLAGSMGFCFGNNPLWYYGTANDGNPGWALATGDQGTFASWRTSLNSPGSQDGARAGAFFRSIAWQTLVPDTTARVLTSGSGVVAAASADGKLAVAYFSRGGSAEINLAAFSGAVIAQWFDPSSGAYATISGSPFAHSGSHAFTSPARNSVGMTDWVLVLRASAP